MPVGALQLIVVILAGIVIIGVAWENARERWDQEGEAWYEKESRNRLWREIDRHDRRD